MASKFNANAERDVREAQFCRVAIYPPVRGWVGERVQLEVAISPEKFGETEYLTDTGYYLVVGDPEEVRAEAELIRGTAVELVRVGE
ncbi:hypothetical protein [Aeromonas veronii]|uniref:hypothetical protein n=1 Tax=Aeromonas veronii TaxID=654 RepID=UPI003BA1D920